MTDSRSVGQFDAHQAAQPHPTGGTRTVEKEPGSQPAALSDDRSAALIESLRSQLQEEEARNGALRVQLARAMEWRTQHGRVTQQLVDMQAAQDEFLRAVSHDLRAPLRHVTSYSALVRETLEAVPNPNNSMQEALGFINTMSQSAKRMGLMLDGLLALAHASRAPLHCVPVPLNAALEQARQNLAAAEVRAAQHQTSHLCEPAQWDIPADLPSIHADPSLLQNLFGHLFANALKFTRGCKAPRIAVRAERAETGGWHITVQDNGVGFDPTRAAGLFGVFQRLHREGEFEGVGVGLAISHRITQRHGATISVQGGLGGQGCTVELHWPAQVPGIESSDQAPGLTGMAY
jgi:signal transduction histidine kinase